MRTNTHTHSRRAKEEISIERKTITASAGQLSFSLALASILSSVKGVAAVAEKGREGKGRGAATTATLIAQLPHGPKDPCSAADDAPDLCSTAHMRLFSRAVAQRATNLSMDAQCRIKCDRESERE